ncbi:hypothetical protein Q5X39_03955 [Acinetobacter baumannii]|nr:hypothetical protein [Acinetobacter baumannii]MDO7400083.1 hypothetical protein [Acinetobacter baumannii]
MANETSTSEKLQKDNITNIWKTICLDFLVLNIILSSLNFENFINLFFSKNMLDNSLFKLLTSFIMGILIVKLLLNIIPAEIKHNIIFGRLKNSLPGHRAFSDYIYKDSRIDIDNLKKNLGIFPSEPNEQNRIWYKIYQKHKNDEQIVESHVRFLFFRDCSILTIFILFGFIFLCIFFRANIFQWITSISFIIIQLTILIISARNNGIRFVQNVLCIESHKTL